MLSLPANIQAAVGQKHRGLRQLSAAHLYRALTAIVIQHQVWLIYKIAVALHKVSHRHIAVGGFTLGFGGLHVPIQIRAIAQAAQRPQERDVQMRKAGGEHIGNHQRPSVDEGIARNASLCF